MVRILSSVAALSLALCASAADAPKSAPAESGDMKVLFNGKDLTGTDDPILAVLEGVLALQLHAGKPMWAEFKDIRIKDLK